MLSEVYKLSGFNKSEALNIKKKKKILEYAALTQM